MNHFFESLFLPLLYKTNVLYRNSSALIWGASHSKYCTIKRILDHRYAKVNTRDQDSRTAIFHAIKSQNEEILNMLLNDSRLNVNCQDRKWQTPLLYALSYRKGSIAGKLLKHYDTSAIINDNKGRTALWYTITSCEERLIQQLLGKGSSNNEPNYKGFSPLTVTIQQGNSSLANLLLSYLPQCRQRRRFFSAAKADKREPLLYFAIRQRRAKITYLLLAHRADINSRDLYLRSPLHIAVENGDVKSTAMLLN